MSVPSLLLVLSALSAAAAAPPAILVLDDLATTGDPATACAVARLKPFVSPYGIRQRWPVATALPASHENALGTLLSGTGPVADGYRQVLHIDRQARAVYLVEEGGFAGTRKVFGPLPLPQCAPAGDAATAAPPR